MCIGWFLCAVFFSDERLFMVMVSFSMHHNNFVSRIKIMADVSHSTAHHTAIQHLPPRFSCSSISILTSRHVHFSAIFLRNLYPFHYEAKIPFSPIRIGVHRALFFVTLKRAQRSSRHSCEHTTLDLILLSLFFASPNRPIVLLFNLV